jgi:hypothetical protein
VVPGVSINNPLAWNGQCQFISIRNQQSISSQITMISKIINIKEKIKLQPNSFKTKNYQNI